MGEKGCFNLMVVQSDFGLNFVRRSSLLIAMRLRSLVIRPSTHIYASFTKPVDIDELLYWLKNIIENEPGSRDSPEA